MAKPQRQSMVWLPIPTDIFTDTISQGLRATFGPLALTVRLALRLAIAHQGYYAYWNNALAFSIADQVPGVSPDILGKIVNFLVDNGEYDTTIFASDKVLTSEHIQQAWLRCKRNRRATEQAPFWISAKVITDTITPITDTITPITDTITPQQYNNKKNILSPVVDNIQKKDNGVDNGLSSKFPDLDNEISTLAADDPWIEHMQMRLHAPRQNIIDLLNDFRDACIERGKTAHRSIADAKQHFVSWNNRRLYSSNSQNTPSNDKNNNRYPSRRSAVTPGFGIARS